MKKIDKSSVVFMSVIVAFVLFISGSFYYCNQCTEYEYALSEMSDGIYAIYYNTYSNVPAHNYDVVTLCCNDNVHTYTGNVSISFTEGEPYVKVQDYNYVNGDNVYVYVPKGTVSYEDSVNIR